MRNLLSALLSNQEITLYSYCPENSPKKWKLCLQSFKDHRKKTRPIYIIILRKFRKRVRVALVSLIFFANGGEYHQVANDIRSRYLLPTDRTHEL